MANVELAAMRGATVVAVASAAKHEEVRARGAHHVIEREADLVGELRRTVGEKQLHVILDVVGGPSFPAMLSNLEPGGHYVAAGAIAGPLVKLDLRELIYADLRMTGQATARPEALQNLVRYAEAGVLRPRIAAIYPLGELIEAQRAFVNKAYVGKIVIDVDRAESPICS
ncbi:zinc-binding dehydrogenase [Nesterenkonia lutea]|uniref:NADPH:quinone reductase-like Zn-dependent oxidoreductase n=1 Tax=Nesterenkonia lutea TaxID=272919 RepID=A0ABR9JHZ3_9MICC|nr:zinc-binding dehydrogenase [Nesterenkonia lutea]MBE1525541.1 NADPH:quinone reductase-like Zn-dependent oxidoreductase [Nesterenkonia lutea]